MAHAHELYLIRHGVAEDRGEAWPDDAKRPLTDRGIARLRKAARGLAAIGVDFDVILTSPLVRARQTADVIAAGLEPRPAIVAVDALAPGAGWPALAAELARHARRPRIALVGHEPGMGELAARLIGTRHALEFKKGAMARIDVSAVPPVGPGTLRWLLPPGVLRRLR